MGGNISPLNRVHVNCHCMSPKLRPHPATLSVFKPFVLQSPDAFCLIQVELPSSHSHTDTAFYTLNVPNHNTVVLPFCRSAQKIEFMLRTLGGGNKPGARIWELSFSGISGSWLLLWRPLCSGGILMMISQSFLCCLCIALMCH